MKKILVVGQTPPPYGGQAVMIEHLVNWNYNDVKLYHVRMVFSRGMRDMGKMQLYKIWHLLSIILKIYYYRVFKGADTLYYPPSGPNSAVFRDMAILFTTRWMFRRTIFHFHASGLSEHLKRKSKIFQWFFKCSFFYPDVTIKLSESCPNEGESIKAKKVVIVPNGLPDEAIVINEQKKKDILNLLFIGLLEESKGELDLCRAIKMMKDRGTECYARIAGEFKTLEYKKKFFAYIKDNKLEGNVEYLGIIRGADKEKAFRQSDVFCFPSFFHSESFPLVLIEAMSYGLPIVTTKWRGIVDMVEDGKNGYLCETHSPEQLATKIEKLSTSVELRTEIGKNAREVFDERYDIRQHLKLMENIFNNI